MITRADFKDGNIYHYEIMRNEVESKIYTRIDKLMSKLIQLRSLPRQKILITFAGYDFDKRELIEIPDVVLYTQTLIKQHPYFWYYVVPSTPFFTMAMTIDLNNYRYVAFDTVRMFAMEADRKATIRLVKNMSSEIQTFGKSINDVSGANDSLSKWYMMMQNTMSSN